MRLSPKVLCVGAFSALSAFAAVQPVTTLAQDTPIKTANPTVITVNPTVITKVPVTSQTQVVSTSQYTNSTSTRPTSTVVSTSKSTSTPQPSSTTKPLPPTGTRTADILADIKGFYNLPTGGDVIKNATLNGTEIQCDILVGMRKKMESFYFFYINNVTSFKYKLHNDVVPQITNVQDILSVSSQPLVALNIAFSQSGLTRLGINDNVQDPPFSAGQTADANNLGDAGTTTWVQNFIGTKIHGVFLIASDTQALISAEIAWLEALFGTDMIKIYEVDGHIRPPPYDGHEMFGFLDGVGQPAVAGFNVSPVPGQQVISPGVILTGEPGDTLLSARPAWMKDGSFMVFRQLKQLVPEFDKFLWNNAPPVGSLTQAQSAELLGARMVGRWKSGAPVDLTPLADNPAMGANPLVNNNFDFFHTGFPPASDESHCPFAAHIRKSRPRSDQPSPFNAIMRSGIPYGPELTAAEIARNASSTSPDLERGLAFVSYQSRIDLGFRFIQMQWANNIGFPFGKIHNPGHDPIFGQNNGGARFMAGYDIANTNLNLALPTEFVISRGGEYFFSPSIPAIRDFISV